MRICIVAEGCYPYVVGGVSGWINNLINAFPNQEFILLAVISDRKQSGKFAYKLPENVTEVHEVYLNDTLWGKGASKRKLRLSKKQYSALCGLLMDEETDWKVLMEMLQNRKVSIDRLLMGPDFMKAVTLCYEKNHSEIVYSDFLWTMRSMYLPLFLTLKSNIPKADLYHCVATGYSGLLGSAAKKLYGSGLMISEHGIYTREREEELIKASWLKGMYKGIWIDQFKKMSRFAYQMADVVTSLYEQAGNLQVELGCPREKTMVTPNGIQVERFEGIVQKEENDDFINIGAILRVTPIKDVKTMITAFAYAKARNPRLKLWIIGPVDEEKEYAKECFELVNNLEVSDVVFTGSTDIRQYLGKMDFTILTSISEGQPLTILESFAARKPVIATDVGNCNGLIYGESDDFGPAGIITHIMNIEEITSAMLELAESDIKRQEMGEAGYRRVCEGYTIDTMKERYRMLYRRFAEQAGIQWSEEKFSIQIQKGNK